MSEEDKRKLMTQKCYVPGDSDGLKTSIRNTVAMAKMTFGKRAYITLALKKLKDEIKNIDPFLKPYFQANGENFGKHFAQSIHAGIALFLSRAGNGIAHMQPIFLDFSDLIIDIQTQRLRLPLTDVNNQYTDNKKKDRGKEVRNPNKNESDILTNENYRRLFAFRNRQGLELPRMTSGSTMCWNWHGKGSCKANCERKDTHRRLNRNERDSWNNFIAALRRRMSSQNQNGNQYNGRNNNNNVQTDNNGR